MFESLMLLLMWLLLNLLRITFAEHPILEISDGRISGRELRTPEGKSFFSFEGIPYAEPPLGNLRFSDPRPPVKWAGIKNCSHSNVVCIQGKISISEFETEDCLILNVYTPKAALLSTERGLAVMVYIYGGGYYIGNATYEALGPDFLMDYDVILVTLNYRLGPFGFLSTGDSVIPGNAALRDQQLALKWVQNNIRVFDGDPEKVLIFGNSAGASSVGYHILSKQSKGLFRAGILSSGSPLNAWSSQLQSSKVAHLTAQYVNESKIFKTSGELLDYLRSVSAMDLRKAFLRVLDSDAAGIEQGIHGYFYAPVIDNYIPNGFIQEHAYASMEIGRFSHVPIIIGITSEEFLNGIEVKDKILKFLVKYEMKKELLFSDHLYTANIEEKKTFGHNIYNIYFPENKTLVQNFDRVIRFLSDQWINFGVLKHAYLASKFTKVFLYQFSYDGLIGNFSELVEGAECVTHTEDMNYIFRKDLPTANNTKIKDFPESDRLVQKRLLQLYTNFAKYLNPTAVKYPELQGVEWPPVNAKGPDNALYLDININLEVKSNLKHDTYSKWNEIFTKYVKRPYVRK